MHGCSSYVFCAGENRNCADCKLNLLASSLLSSHWAWGKKCFTLQSVHAFQHVPVTTLVCLVSIQPGLGQGCEGRRCSAFWRITHASLALSSLPMTDMHASCSAPVLPESIKPFMHACSCHVGACSLPYGNSIFFPVKRIEDPIGLLPAKLILGINKRGVHFFRPVPKVRMHIRGYDVNGSA